MEYPFGKKEKIEKSKMVDFIESNIADQRFGNRKRIWSAIRDARKRKGTLEIYSKGGSEYFIAINFFEWAFIKWPELREVHKIPPPSDFYPWGYNVN